MLLEYVGKLQPTNVCTTLKLTYVGIEGGVLGVGRAVGSGEGEVLGEELGDGEMYAGVGARGPPVTIIFPLQVKSSTQP